MRPVCLVALLAQWAIAQAPGPSKWQIKYFHDRDDTAIAFEDLTFVSPTHGLAAGALVPTGRGGKSKGVVLITTDGGERWAELPLPDQPTSLFALDQANVWMVGQNAIWKSREFGRDWKKISKLKGVLRVHFLDEQRGFAVGLSKSVWQTIDGGTKWTPVPEAQAGKSSARYTAYTNITFLNNQRGLIAGFSRPPRPTDLRAPVWMDPTARVREVPGVTLLLETTDGGRNWASSTTSAFGQVLRMVLGPAGGLTVMEFGEGFQFPSEVLAIDYKLGKSTRVFREKNRAVKDVAIDAQGHALLAAIERKGELGHLPIPGPLTIYQSADLQTWTEQAVDYKAVANSAVLATGRGGANFVATDTGMILKFEATR